MTPPTDTDADTDLACANCGDGLTPAEYVAVGPSTPAARELGLVDESVEQVAGFSLAVSRSGGHYVVCDACFEIAVDRIQTDGAPPR